MLHRAGINRRHDQSHLRKRKLVAGDFNMSERDDVLSPRTTRTVTGFGTNIIKTKLLKNFVVAFIATFVLSAATPVWAADATAVKIGNFTFGPQELRLKQEPRSHGQTRTTSRTRSCHPTTSDRRRSILTAVSRLRSRHRVPISIFVPYIRI